MSVCVECLFLTTPSRAPYRTPPWRAPKGRPTDPPYSFSDIYGAWFGLGSGFGIGFTLTLLLARAPLLLATLLSHTRPFPPAFTVPHPGPEVTVPLTSCTQMKRKQKKNIHHSMMMMLLCVLLETKK
jgi:hypothetical protein